MNENILKMLQVTDALFPIGGYAFSDGLETYVSRGVIKNADDLKKYLNAYLFTIAYGDLAYAFRAAAGEDIEKLDAFVSAAKASYEIRNGSIKKCAAFLKAVRAMGEYKPLSDYAEKIRLGKCDGHFSVAIGIFIKASNTNAETALLMYGYSILSTTVNQAVKLVPLRQLDGQRVLFETAKKLPSAVKTAIYCPRDMMGISGCGFDISSMMHENLYARMYMS